MSLFDDQRKAIDAAHSAGTKRGWRSKRSKDDGNLVDSQLSAINAIQDTRRPAATPISVGSPGAARPAASAVATGVPAASGSSPATWAPAPATGQASELACRLCGGRPAADVTFRVHQGMVIRFTGAKSRGPFCRNCGIAMFRRTTAHTLAYGWWGIFSIFATPIVLLLNWRARQKIVRLPEPSAAVPGGTRLTIGRPLYRRWAMLGPAILATVIGFVVYSTLTSTSWSASETVDQNRPAIGMCIVDIPNENTMRFTDCGNAHDGVITEIFYTESATCPDSTKWELYGTDRNGSWVACVAKYGS